MYSVYLLMFPNGRGYVGATKDVKKRLRQHWYSSKAESELLVHQAIREQGWPKVVVDVLYRCETKKQAIYEETRLIDKLGTKHPNGYNECWDVTSLAVQSIRTRSGSVLARL